MIIKTCGLRELENITAVGGLAVDWIGLIFYGPSPRYVGEKADLLPFLDQAKLKQKRVGVFVNPTFKDLLATVQTYQLDAVQLHGAESAVYCRSVRLMLDENQLDAVKIIRAFRISQAFDFGVTLDYEEYCDFFIFDTKGKLYGGTGHQFDWTLLDRYTGNTPFLLSGGIGPDDAAAVMALKHPQMAGVDLNSKFEIEPALKNIDALSAFVKKILL